MEDGEVMDEDELLLEKPEVFAYKIPPKIGRLPGKHLAADWDVNNPVWCGKIRIHGAESSCHVLLENEDGKVYGISKIDEMPGTFFAPVADSSRYFTLKLEDWEGKRSLIGIGFSSRDDSKEVKEVIEDYFMMIRSHINKRADEELDTNGTDPVEKPEASSSNETPLGSQEDIDKPSTSDDQPTQNVCEHCSTSFDSKDQWISHGDPATQAITLIRDVPVEYPYITESRKHFECYECEEPFLYNHSMMIHWKKIHKLTPAFCSTVKLWFPGHKKPQSLECPTCFMTFFSFSSQKFQQHKCTSKIVTTNAKAAKGTKSNYCKSCNYLISDISGRHLCDMSIWKCGVCDKKFALNGLTKHHSRPCDDEARKAMHMVKKWKCGLCSKSFSHKKRLLAHSYMVHT